jgi:DNA-binding GntR family transcriptional regulator
MRPSDSVYTSLKRRILLNAVPPGGSLTELAVAREFACSQGTVREALLRLQEDGLVLRARNRGTTVTPLDAEVAVEMLALRRRLEIRAAMRAAAKATRLTVAELTDIQDRMDQAAQDDDAYGLIEFDTQFHMLIFRLSGFQALEQILLRCILHSHRQKLWEPRHRRSLRETAGRHRQIIAALQQGGDALAAALGHHIDTIVDVAPESLAS